MSQHWPIFSHESLPSTQDEAKRLLASKTPVPFIVIANHQTAGRGRAGHSWTSLPNNLQCTIVLPTKIALRHAGQYAFVVGLAYAEMLAQYGVEDAQLKWPNDVLVDGKKIAGILLESDIGMDGELSHLLIGVGGNVGSSPDGALCLHYLIKDRPVPRDVLNVFQRYLGDYIQQFEANGFAPIREKWLSKAYSLNKLLRVRLPHEQFEGVFVDLAEDGSLLVQTNEQSPLRRVYAGDVFFGET